MEYNNLDGFIIDANNIVGEVHIVRDQNISNFLNPYLAHLPYPSFSFISVPTTRCDALESVMNIRFNHEVFGHDGLYKHNLIIVKDIGLRAFGLEIRVHFNTNGNITQHAAKMDLIKGIDLKNIVLGKNEVNTSDNYSITSASLYKHTLSSISKCNINDELREDFWKDIKTFFNQYDLYNRSEPV